MRPDVKLQDVIKLYDLGMSCRQIAQKFNTSYDTINKRLRKSNIKFRDRTNYRKWTLDCTYFDNINTQDKAYILGFIMADGYNNTTKGQIAIKLSPKDKDILEQIKQKLSYNGPLITGINKVFGSCFPNIKLLFNSRYLSNQLLNLGVHNNKSDFLKFPDYLCDPLIHHFIRGYFDGDGSMSCNYIKTKYNSKLLNGYVSFTGCKEFLYSVQDILLRYEIKSSLYKNKLCQYVYQLNINGNKNVQRFYNFLYKDANIYMERKFDKFLEFNQKYGD